MKDFLHRHRVYQIMNHVRANYPNEFDLASLADQACLSKFHFSRVFSKYAKETPYQYVSRLRLEKAAQNILTSEKENITTIALDSGFSGSDIFSRAFNNRFGCSPKSFRESGKTDKYSAVPSEPLSNQIIIPQLNLPIEEWPDLSVSIERRPEYHIAYIRHLGPYGDLNGSISTTFIELKKWAKDRAVLTKESSFLGRCPDSCYLTPAQYCMYDAGIVLNNEILEDEIVTVQTIPAGLFAVVRVTCEPKLLNRIWDWLYSDWLKRSDYKAIDAPNYEFFPRAGNRPLCPRFGIELCAPIEQSRSIKSQ